MFKKLVLITRKTRLEGLIERFNTRSQAKFYIEHAAGDFADYECEDDAYRAALEVLRRTLEFGIPVQMVDRSLVPTEGGCRHNARPGWTCRKHSEVRWRPADRRHQPGTDEVRRHPSPIFARSGANGGGAGSREKGQYAGSDVGFCNLERRPAFAGVQ